MRRAGRLREHLAAPREAGAAGATISVFVGPVDAGNYQFFDGFDPAPRGRLIVK